MVIRALHAHTDRSKAEPLCSRHRSDAGGPHKLKSACSPTTKTRFAQKPSIDSRAGDPVCSATVDGGLIQRAP